MNVFQNRMLFQWGKINQKFMFFSAPCTNNREKNSPATFDMAFWGLHRNVLWWF